MSQQHKSGRTFEERLNTWVQIGGILIAAAWGVWTFIFKEIEVPKSAPVNISLNLQLKKIESPENNEGLSAIEMKISATNPSTREIYLLPNAWVAYGGHIAASPPPQDKVESAANDTLQNGQDLVTAQRYMQLDKRVLIAVGHLFADASLKPSEGVSRTLVFYVPKREYDVVYLSAWIPTAADPQKVQIHWSLDKQEVRHDFYRPNKDGTPSPINVQEEGKQFALQEAIAQAEISLLSEKPNQ